jgi:hypothetical protein
MSFRSWPDLPTWLLLVCALLAAAAFAADASGLVTGIALAALFAALIARTVLARRAS